MFWISQDSSKQKTILSILRFQWESYGENSIHHIESEAKSRFFKNHSTSSKVFQVIFSSLL